VIKKIAIVGAGPGPLPMLLTNRTVISTGARVTGKTLEMEAAIKNAIEAGTPYKVVKSKIAEAIKGDGLVVHTHFTDAMDMVIEALTVKEFNEATRTAIGKVNRAVQIVDTITRAATEAVKMFSKAIRPASPSLYGADAKRYRRVMRSLGRNQTDVN